PDRAGAARALAGPGRISTRLPLVLRGRGGAVGGCSHRQLVLSRTSDPAPATADMKSDAEFSVSEMVGLWRGFWKGGYWEGDPLDPFGRSSYAQMGFISVIHAIHQVCIKPNVGAETRVLEIGPGRGAWTK